MPRHSTGWSFTRFLMDRNRIARKRPAPDRLTPSEAIIISRSGHTVESWDRLTPQQRADIRWRIGTGQ